MGNNCNREKSPINHNVSRDQHERKFIKISQNDISKSKLSDDLKTYN